MTRRLAAVTTWHVWLGKWAIEAQAFVSCVSFVWFVYFVVPRNRSGLVLQFINTMTFAARDFWAGQGASDAHTLQRSVRSEQRRLGQKEPPPGGLRRFSVLASLLLGHSPTAGDAPSSRLARTENRRNKRHRTYE